MPKRSASSSIASPTRKKALGSISETSSSDPDSDEFNKDVGIVDEGKNQTAVTSGVEIAFFEFFRSVSKGDDLSKDYARIMRNVRDFSNVLLGGEEPTERKSMVDQFMRNFLLRRILTQSRTSCSQFLELGIALAKENICTPSVLFTLISDFFELSSLNECQRIFEFVENHLDVWKEPLFLHSGKNAVLRMCNDLLRRLSRAQNTIFCGRILIFLSNYFPLCERSGLNVLSEFNTENVTVYKTNDGTDDEDPEDKMDTVEDEKIEAFFEEMHIEIPGLNSIIEITKDEKKKMMEVDYNLYIKFWSLQDYFRRPLECYGKVAWKTFTLYITDVLTALSYFKTDPASASKSNTMRKRSAVGYDSTVLSSDSSISDIPRLADECSYFAKYLTNRRLLELQMNDPNFRRHFLVQLLVIFQYLTVNVKFKNESHILSEEQQEFVRKTSERVFQLLEEIPPCGNQFVQAVKHILTREQLWNQWKNDGCPAFKKPDLGGAVMANLSRLNEKDGKMDTREENSLIFPEEVADSKRMGQDDVEISGEVEKSPKLTMKTRRRHLGNVIAEAEENGRFLMGNSELTRLWNICGDNLEACRLQARDFSPPIDVFFAEAFKQLEMNAAAQKSKKEAQPKKMLANANFGWRALRLLAQKSPYFFQNFGSSPIKPLQNYLEFVLGKILAEKEDPLQSLTPDRLEKSDDSEEKEEEKTAEMGSREEKKRDDEEEAEMEGEVEENAVKSQVRNEPEEDDMKNEVRNDSEEDEKDNDVNEMLRNLTDAEMKSLGKQLGPAWKELALKLTFTADEIQYFEEQTVKDPDSVGAYMLQRWTEEEREEATVADLLYRLEGLGMKKLADSFFL